MPRRGEKALGAGLFLFGAVTAPISTAILKTLSVTPGIGDAIARLEDGAIDFVADKAQQFAHDQQLDLAKVGRVALGGLGVVATLVLGYKALPLLQKGVSLIGTKFGALASTGRAAERTAINLTERGTLSNLRPGDPAFLQSPARTLVQDDAGRYWLQSASGKRITPSGNYDFVTMPNGLIRVARPNTNPEFSTHLGLSGGQDVSYAASIRFANRNIATRGSIRAFFDQSGSYPHERK